MLKHLGTCALASAAALAAASTAGAANTTVSGGQLDGRFTTADVYVDTPKEATAPQGRACQMAKRYLHFINTGEVGKISALFEDGAVHLGALGTSLRGRDEIDAFFKKTIGPLKAGSIPVAFAANGADCFAEVAVMKSIDGQTRWVLAVVDHFTVGASGKIVREVAYPRPTPAPAQK